MLVFSEIGFAAVNATSDDNWTAQPLYRARSLSAPGPDPLTPTQIISAYNLASQSGGAGNTIAIIDAYDTPNIASDLATFNSNFGLPAANFVKHKMSNSISVNSGWALETSLDVEWAHAIAPNANILLVEATTNSLSNLLAAVNYATSQPGVVAVSMSWGSSEFSSERSYDNYFSSQGIVFFASSGDTGGAVIWPSSSPNVVSVGGTTLNMAGNTVTSETAWSGSGGGVSTYESTPTYQTTYGLTYAKRATPDVSYDADPNTGVYVYDSTPYSGSSGWWTVGGTSAGAPQWAAIQALGITANNTNFYSIAKSASYSTYLRDIVSGSNGYAAGVGYDLATGLGSPLTTNFGQATTPDFSLSTSASALKIQAGQTGTATLTAAALGGFSGTVTLSVSDPNNWATTSPTSISIPPSGTATLSIPVPPTASAGISTVTVTGTSGALVHTVAITYNVTVPDFTVTASPTSMTIAAGSQGTSTIRVTALNGFTGTVALSATSSPLTTSFNPTSIQTSGTSTLTITAPSGTSAGTYTVTVTAASGSISHSATVTVTVTNPDFTVSASPSSLSVRSGQQGTSRITVSALNGFRGTVSLSASVSGGLTVSVSPSSVTNSGTSTLTVRVPSSIRSGTFTVTVTATSGTLRHTTTVTVTATR